MSRNESTTGIRAALRPVSLAATSLVAGAAAQLKRVRESHLTRRWSTMHRGVSYLDRVVMLDDDSIVIRRYYFPFGRKRIRYSDIRQVQTRGLGLTSGQYRRWGLGWPNAWYHRDAGRPEKDTAMKLDVGRRIQPTLTPDDPTAVMRILQDRGVL